MSNESGRQATARAEAMKLLSTDHQVDWNDTGGYLALWFESGRSYTEALDWIRQGVLLPTDIIAAEAGGLPGEIAQDEPAVHVSLRPESTEVKSRLVKAPATSSPKVPQPAKPKRPAPKKKP